MAAGPTDACRAGSPRRAARGPPPRSRSRPAMPRTTSSRRRASSSVASERRMQKDRCLPATDASSELMELREPEPLRVLDEDDAGIRHVDADLDHRRRHEQVDLTGRECRSSSRRAGPPSAARARGRSAAPARPPEAAPPRLRHSPPGARGLRRRAARRRTTAAPPTPSAARKASIFGQRTAGRGSRCGSAARPGGSWRIVLIDEVAVHGEAQGARNRRGGQRQDVRLSPAALRLKRRALSDAEAMLLVDHDEPQARELDGLADHGMGADDHLCHAAGRWRRGSPAFDAPEAIPRGTRPGPRGTRGAGRGRHGAAAPGSRSAP